MKALKVATLLLLLAVVSPAARPGSAQDPTGVTVTPLGWNKYEYRIGWDKPEFTAETRETSDMAGAVPWQKPAEAREPSTSEQDLGISGSESTSPSRRRGSKILSTRRFGPDGVFEGYQYHASFKNTGKKTIKSITWNYLFVDPDSGKEVGRHTFTSEKKIRPGKRVKLSEVSQTAPTFVVSAGRGFTERAVIDRVAFTDGSVWQRPTGEPGKDGPDKNR